MYLAKAPILKCLKNTVSIPNFFLFFIGLWFTPACICIKRNSWDPHVGDYKNFTRVVLDVTEIVQFKKFLANETSQELSSICPQHAGRKFFKRRKGTAYSWIPVRTDKSQKARLVIDFSVPTVVGRSFVLPGSSGKPYRIVVEAKHSKSKSISEATTDNNSSGVGKEILTEILENRLAFEK